MSGASDGIALSRMPTQASYTTMAEPENGNVFSSTTCLAGNGGRLASEPRSRRQDTPSRVKLKMVVCAAVAAAAGVVVGGLCTGLPLGLKVNQTQKNLDKCNANSEPITMGSVAGGIAEGIEVGLLHEKLDKCNANLTRATSNATVLQKDLSQCTANLITAGWSCFAMGLVKGIGEDASVALDRVGPQIATLSSQAPEELQPMIANLNNSIKTVREVQSDFNTEIGLVYSGGIC